VIAGKERELALPRPNFPRAAHYCSGCPHNTSTVVPEGSRALGGIGCHYMVTWMDRNTATFSHMGGEGAAWLGQAPFTETRHVFVNLGDGTYYHSGILAVRAAVAARCAERGVALALDDVSSELPVSLEQPATMRLTAATGTDHAR